MSNFVDLFNEDTNEDKKAKRAAMEEMKRKNNEQKAKDKEEKEKRRELPKKECNESFVGGFFDNIRMI